MSGTPEGLGVGRCALCGEVGPLCESHIISEFLYAPVYDEKHRFVDYSTDPGQRTRMQQKGLRERLLCAPCEQERVSPLESYARRVLHGGRALQYRTEPWGVTVLGIDYVPFKLFQLSLLWRAAVARRSEFEAVDLGPHEERVRLLLLRNDPGRAYEYPCLLCFPPDARSREIFNHVISPPDMVRAHGHRVYRFLLGAMFWLFSVSSHTRQLLDDGLISLFEDGSLRVYNGGAHAMNYLSRFAAEISGADAARARTSSRARGMGARAAGERGDEADGAMARR